MKQKTGMSSSRNCWRDLAPLSHYPPPPRSSVHAAWAVAWQRLRLPLKGVDQGTSLLSEEAQIHGGVQDVAHGQLHLHC